MSIRVLEIIITVEIHLGIQMRGVTLLMLRPDGKNAHVKPKQLQSSRRLQPKQVQQRQLN